MILVANSTMMLFAIPTALEPYEQSTFHEPEQVECLINANTSEGRTVQTQALQPTMFMATFFLFTVIPFARIMPLSF